MRYVMRRKPLFLGRLRDPGRERPGRILVDGKAFSLGNQLSFQDMQGNELAYIRQKLLAWGPTYEIYGQGQLRVVVKKAIFTLIQCSFSVDVPGPDDLEARGDFTDHEYTFERGGRSVATMSKRGSLGRTPMVWTSKWARTTS